MERESLWSRRSNSTKFSPSANHTDKEGNSEQPARGYATRRHNTSDTSPYSKLNGRNTIAPLNTSNTVLPTPGASSAFGLGSGAFASFGSASKTPKTPGGAFDFGKNATQPPAISSDKKSKAIRRTPDSGSSNQNTSSEAANASKEFLTTEREQAQSLDAPSSHTEETLCLRHTWVIWFRPPTSKNADYEKSIQPMLRFSTAQEFWRCYLHLKRPSSLPIVSDYHLFRHGVRPVWEDEENRKGGKFQIRLKKGVADRLWENLLLAMVGDQFSDAGDEVCGAVISVRNGEDVLSVWTKYDGGRNVKILQVLKQVLECPRDIKIEWKSHDDSIAQRIASDQYKQDKVSGSHHLGDKRRTLTSEDVNAVKRKLGLP